jgi:hypothetical protein
MADDEDEDEGRFKRNYERNKAFAKKGEYFTQLNPASEAKFRAWLKANKVPFDPNAKITDYDMRGFWTALQTGSPLATTAINPNDKQLHFPDTWKTPYHESFSADSQWAVPGLAPKWNDLDQLVLPGGQIVFDEKAKAAAAAQSQPVAPAPTVSPQMNPALPAASPAPSINTIGALPQ